MYGRVCAARIGKSTIVLVACAGCGRLAFDPVSSQPPDDASGPADACALGPWSAPVQLTALSSPDTEWAADLSPDGLELMFTSDRTGDFDLYLAKRASQLDVFTAPVRLAAVSVPGTEAGPTWKDALTVYFEAPTGSSIATRASPTAPFGPPSPATDVESFSPFGMEFTADGDELFYGFPTTNRARRVGTTYQDLGPVTELGQGGYPTLSHDALTIYFMTTRNGPEEIFTASRPDRMSPFEAPHAVSELNADGDGDDPTISDDGRTIVFRSTRTGDPSELFMSTRACAPR